MKFRHYINESLESKLKKASKKVLKELLSKDGIENDNKSDINQWVADLLGEYVTLKNNDDKEYEIFNKYVNDIYNKFKKDL